MKIKQMYPSCAVVSDVVINSELRRSGNMAFYQQEVLNVGGKYVSIPLNRRVFYFQMGIRPTKLLWQVHIS